jgi:hypothetical protein
MTIKQYAYATRISFTDREPCEIVRHVSERTIDVRQMNAVRSNPEADMGFVPGGFVGHFANQNVQQWTCTPDETNPVVRVRLTRKGWFDKYGQRYNLTYTPHKFHDYNF